MWCNCISGTGATKTITIGGSALTIQEDGSSLSTSYFNGLCWSNITATGSGATKTIDVRSTTTILDVNITWFNQ